MPEPSSGVCSDVWNDLGADSFDPDSGGPDSFDPDSGDPDSVEPGFDLPGATVQRTVCKSRRIRAELSRDDARCRPVAGAAGLSNGDGHPACSWADDTG